MADGNNLREQADEADTRAAEDAEQAERLRTAAEDADQAEASARDAESR